MVLHWKKKENVSDIIIDKEDWAPEEMRTNLSWPQFMLGIL